LANVDIDTASVSTVELGPFESQFHQKLLHEDPGGVEDFAVFIYRYVDELGRSTMLGTRAERLDGIKVYNVGLPGYLAVIKVVSLGVV
jgi:hypothetical protein